MQIPLFPKVLIIGVGLIGGSMALCLKKQKMTDCVVGFDCDLLNAEAAKKAGIIDRIGHIFSEDIPTADLIILAVPVGEMANTMQAIASYLNDRCLLVDVGSTKVSVIDAARQYLGHHVERFVPSHPIAGAEKNGALAAKADLFNNHQVVMTPLPENAVTSVGKINTFWEVCGASVVTMTAERHDRFFAAVSHLPHLLSYALVYEISRRENGDEFFSFAAGGFRDFTRIAASSPHMWKDICLANKAAILEEMTAYESVLSELKDCLINEDSEHLMEIFEASRKARRYWGEKKHW